MIRANTMKLAKIADFRGHRKWDGVQIRSDLGSSEGSRSGVPQKGEIADIRGLDLTPDMVRSRVQMGSHPGHPHDPTHEG